MNNIVLELVIILFVGFCIGFSLSFFLTDNISTDCEDLYNSVNIDLVACQENEIFLEDRYKVVKNDLDDLQLVYNSLNGDFQVCYFSVLCLEHPGDCEDYFLDEGLSAVEAYDYYSGFCLGAYRDWDLYVAKDTDFT